MSQQLLQQETGQNIPLFYNNHMSSEYKDNKKPLRKIIQDNIQATNPDAQLKLTIYHKSICTSKLIMKNTCLPPISSLQEVNLVYRYTCNTGDCSYLNTRYIGSTITTLPKRITAHLQDRAIKHHTSMNHGTTLTRQYLEDDTTILHKEPYTA